MLPTTGALTVPTLLATYPTTAALKRGAISSALVHLDFADVQQANTAFKSLVRDEKFAVGELAIATYLQAKAFGTPYVLLPIVIVGRSQHHSLVYNSRCPRFPPGEMAGRRVGVRAYTQTTGVWVRGILEDDYGVDFKSVHWVTFEEPHVAAYRDPPWVERAAADKELQQMLLDGELDAAIFGNTVPGAPFAPLIPDSDAAAASWAARHGGTPINHMMVIHGSIARKHPDIVREIYRMLLESQEAATDGARRGAMPFGVERNRRTLELIIEYSVRQGLIPRRLSVDELFDETTRSLE